TSRITTATCTACPPDGLISLAVAETAASAARRSARSCSLPSISSVSFLLPASASCPTSHPQGRQQEHHVSSLPATVQLSGIPDLAVTPSFQLNDEDLVARFTLTAKRSPELDTNPHLHVSLLSV